MVFLDFFRQHEPQIFHYWKKLTSEQKNIFENQLKLVDIKTLNIQKNLTKESVTFHPSHLQPFDHFTYSGNQVHHIRGQRLIQQGEVGCLLLAGGQGTRLKHQGPKGTYPISVVNGKSLFQLCAEKVRAASHWAKRPLELAIMTSPDNDKETRSFFKKHDFFGLLQDQVSFFVQGTLPLLDADGKLFLKTPFQIAEGANGNGNSLLCFAQSGLLDKWVQKGIKIMTVILVDNPLADPFDAELIGHHEAQQADITLKCTEKMLPEEKVGVLVQQAGRCKVVEYSELPEKEKNARDKEGRLSYRCANLSLFCFSLSFIGRMIKEKVHLPLHKAWKASQYLDEKGTTQLSSKPIAWKFETFIFDWLLFAQNVSALIYPREECFAPIKNFSGEDSPEMVRKALQKRDKVILQQLTGLTPPLFPFELPPECYYPTPELRVKWKGRQLSKSEISPFD